MPIYEYRCSACDHLAELLLGLNDPPPQFCLSCGAEGTMRKSFAAPAILFKGSGWAKVDRRSTSTSSAKSATDETAAPKGTTKESGSGSSDTASSTSDGGSSSTTATTSD